LKLINIDRSLIEQNLCPKFITSKKGRFIYNKLKSQHTIQYSMFYMYQIQYILDPALINETIILHTMYFREKYIFQLPTWNTINIFNYLIQ